MTEFTQLNQTPLLSGAPFDPNTPRQAYTGPKPAVLLILDGWGIGPNTAGNAISRAKTPNIDHYWSSYPHTQLSASGQAVGLPHGEDGNTETGHLNIGAGSIVYQDLPRINMSISDGSFAQTPAFLQAMNHVRTQNSALHIMGLVGGGAVHSSLDHLFALLSMCQQQNISRVYLHCFTDGRDSPPTSSIEYLGKVMSYCQQLGVGQVASIMGRYYAMDRDKRWERIEKAYNALTLGNGQVTSDILEALQQQHQKGVTDEFIEPITCLDENGNSPVIQDNDAVIFFNYRIDRPRELTRAFVQADFGAPTQQTQPEESFDPYAVKYEGSHLKKVEGGAQFQRQKTLKNLYFVTMTQYDEKFPVDVAFPPQRLQNPICKIFAQYGLRQLRMAETEKERFVTYYMNGQQEEIYPGEDRIIVPSKGAKSYDQVPEMSAREITFQMIDRIRQGIYDVILCNLANADMVAHTGNLQATITACEVIDECLGQIVTEVTKVGGVVFITADHGNAEELINNDTGEVDTEHSTFPVPFIIISNQLNEGPTLLPTGILGDIAPTMLSVMGLEKPDSMTGRALL